MFSNNNSGIIFRCTNQSELAQLNSGDFMWEKIVFDMLSKQKVLIIIKVSIGKIIA